MNQNSMARDLVQRLAITQPRGSDEDVAFQVDGKVYGFLTILRAMLDRIEALETKPAKASKK